MDRVPCQEWAIDQDLLRGESYQPSHFSVLEEEAQKPAGSQFHKPICFYFQEFFNRIAPYPSAQWCEDWVGSWFGIRGCEHTHSEPVRGWNGGLCKVLIIFRKCIFIGMRWTWGSRSTDCRWLFWKKWKYPSCPIVFLCLWAGAGRSWSSCIGTRVDLRCGTSD